MIIYILILLFLLFFCILYTLYYTPNYKYSQLDFYNIPKYKSIPLIWSKGWGSFVMNSNPYFNSKYFLLGTGDVLFPSCLQKLCHNIKDILWLRITYRKTVYRNDVDNFAKYVLPYLKQPIILITSDGDISIPSDLKGDTANKILNSNMIIKWYTQNYDNTVKHYKLKPIPIGFDLHTSSKYPEQVYKNIISVPDNNNKIFKVFCDSHLSMNKDRKIMFKNIKNNNNMFFQKERIPFSDILKQYSKYKFVISPKGYGLDCHRTWEALYMGAICTKELSLLFEELPVVILNNWSEITHKNMLKWDKLYTPFTKTIKNKISNPSYWLK